MKVIRTISRILVGALFVFSGFVKAIDPLGSTYKFSDYFTAFSLDFFVPLALPLAFLLSAFELVLGISLLLGYRMKTISWLVLVFMSFFTILTFILALYNPVTDCGCFGDALILTNWQTFGKNIILMVFAILIFIGRHKFAVVRGAIFEWSVLGVFFLLVIGISSHCKNHLPIIDFRPYKTGTNIPAATSIPEGAPADVYETRLFYRNTIDGKTSEFTINNFPDDSAWEFVDSKSVLLSKGYEAPIHDFSISAPNGEDLTETIKNDKGFVFLLISYNLPKADKNALLTADAYNKLASVYSGLSFYAVSASIDEDVKNTRESLNLSYDFGGADEIALKTIIRSNPGLLLIKDGTILAKWHYNDFPDLSEIKESLVSMVHEFPMAVGVDLSALSVPPIGARPDKYSTSLVYKNILNDSTRSFSMENFPQGDDWVFVSSHSEKVSSGYISPLKDFKIITPEGRDLSESVLQERGDVFLVVANAPHNLDPDILNRLNKLSVMGASNNTGPVFFYGMSGLSSPQIYGFTDSYITPINFCSGDTSFIKSVAGNGVSLFHLKNGKIEGRWDNAAIPGPDSFDEMLRIQPDGGDFESAIMPYLISKNRESIESQRIYILILAFLFLSLFIRVFLEDPFKNKE
ncbi:MAG: DoxX family protein [Bacteroidales bacterium]|nr:DoxX family protein [Bacteroidales bacterium]